MSPSAEEKEGFLSTELLWCEKCGGVSQNGGLFKYQVLHGRGRWYHIRYPQEGRMWIMQDDKIPWSHIW